MCYIKNLVTMNTAVSDGNVTELSGMYKVGLKLLDVREVKYIYINVGLNDVAMKDEVFEYNFCAQLEKVLCSVDWFL